MMEALSLFQALLAIAVSVAGWFLRMLWDNHNTLEKSIMQHQLDASEKFVRKDDYRVDIAEVKGMLDKIFNQLNTKADK
jgi:hypothetical protein